MDFQKEVIDKSQDIPILVDFWAPWCGPCQMLGPTIEGLSREQEGRWALVKVNVDEHQDLAREYGVPLVIGVDAATEKIHNGDRIAIDGGRGTVTIREVREGACPHAPVREGACPHAPVREGETKNGE